MQVKIEAIIKEAKSKSLVSGDKSYRILLETRDPEAMRLATLPGDREFAVTVETE